VRAADDFSTSVERALFALDDELGWFEAAWSLSDDAGVTDAGKAVGEAVARVARVKLLFGESSEPGATARHLVPHLRTALACLEPRPYGASGELPGAPRGRSRRHAGCTTASTDRRCS
jgi:hypothetical protein